MCDFRCTNWRSAKLRRTASRGLGFFNKYPVFLTKISQKSTFDSGTLTNACTVNPHAFHKIFGSMIKSRFSLLFFIAICAIGCSGINLQEEGIPTRGAVLSKRLHERKLNNLYFITVSYFTQPGKENPGSKKDSLLIVDEIIDQIGKINLEIGEYYTKEIEVGPDVFRSLHPGDNVDLFYDKKNPYRVVLKEDAK